jgi:hypothetical protein
LIKIIPIMKWESNITHQNIKSDEIAGNNRLVVTACIAVEVVCREKCYVGEHRLMSAFFNGSRKWQ